MGEPRLTRYGEWMNARMPRVSSAERNAASSAGLPADNAQPRGLPTKICRVSQPSSVAVARAPAARPLPIGTWVPMGLRAGEPTMARTLALARGRLTICTGQGG